MILKYKSGNSWGYIDNVRQVATKDIDPEVEVLEYDEMMKSMPSEIGWKDPAEHFEDGTRLDENVIISNKVFSATTYDVDGLGNFTHSENLIDPNIISMPITSILLYLEDCKEYDSIFIITNQDAFLMNNEGKTIERLS